MSTAKSGTGRRSKVRNPRGRPNHGTLVNTVEIYGIHAAQAALDNPRRVLLSAIATTNAAQRLEPLFVRRGIEPEIVPPQRLSNRVGADAVHQGVVLLARPLEPVALSDLGGRGPVIALDRVTDPRNLGAILRVAAAFAAAGIIITRRHRPDESGLIAKAASGGLEHVPLVEVTNLARALDEARAGGYWIAGLDSDGDAEIEQAPQQTPLILVLGAEGEGLRRLTRERCDGLSPWPDRRVGSGLARPEARIALDALVGVHTRQFARPPSAAVTSRG